MADMTVQTIDEKQVFALEQTLNDTLVEDGHVVIDLAT